MPYVAPHNASTLIKWLGVLSLFIPLIGYVILQVGLLIDSDRLSGLAFFSPILGLVLGLASWKTKLGKVGLVLNIVAGVMSVTFIYAVGHMNLHITG